MPTAPDSAELKGPQATPWAPGHQKRSDAAVPNHIQQSEPNEPLENQDDSVGGVDVQRKIIGLSWAVVVVALISSTFLYALDNTVLATVRPSMVKSLGRIDLLAWISAAYPMTEVGSNPLWLVVFPSSACSPSKY
jgi:hypothetical protein